MEQPNPSERTLRARCAAHAKWAACDDPSEETRPAREAHLARFEHQVDPDGVLDPAERRRRAEHARKSHMYSLALKSARARRLRAQADELDQEVAEGGGSAA